MSTRRIGALWTSLGMQAVGTVALAAALAILGLWPDLTVAALPWAVVLSALGAGSLYLLYRGLALGPIAVVSPVVASYSALTVVLVVIVLGERLDLAQTAAVTVVFGGVVLSTTDLRTFFASIRRPLPGIPISLAATVGFALWGTLLAAATREHDGLALILMWRMTSVVLLGAIVLAARAAGPDPLRLTTLALIATVGVFDTLANVSFVFGVRTGNAAITATGSGLYPLLPAFLGIVWLGERLAPNQYLGIAVLVAGLVALGLVS
jgi:drug/metabolite transporter (DMT)-like permease